MSTNLAETSITIDDCVFVVEAGRMKEKGFDSTKNMESLDTVWVSQANALQVGLFCALNRYNSQNRLTLYRYTTLDVPFHSMLYFVSTIFREKVALVE